MAIDPEVATSPGDLMRRVRRLERLVERLHADRSLEAAAVGRGGLRLHSGGSLLVDDGGDIRVAGGRIEAVDADDEDVFIVDTNPPAIFMRQELVSSLVNDIVEELLVSPAGQELAAFVFAQRVRTGSVEDFESRASTDYGDLTTPGPTVTDVPVSESGEAVVIVGCANQANPDAGAGSSGGLMSFAISGATTRAADDADSMRCVLTNHNSEGPNQTSTVRASMGVVVTGLNAGLHTFTAKYRAFSPDRPGLFANRNLMVIGL